MIGLDDIKAIKPPVGHSLDTGAMDDQLKAWWAEQNLDYEALTEWAVDEVMGDLKEGLLEMALVSVEDPVQAIAALMSMSHEYGFMIGFLVASKLEKP